MNTCPRDVVRAYVCCLNEIKGEVYLRDLRRSDYSKRKGVIGSGEIYYSFWNKFRFGPFASKQKAIRALAIEMTSKILVKHRATSAGPFVSEIELQSAFDEMVDTASRRLEKLYGRKA